jgi:uncharacterized membrane protein
MNDDVSTPRENVIAVSFSEDANAYEALSRLKDLDAKGEVSVRGAAVVMRGEDGKIVTKDQFGDESVEGTATGGLVGLLVGVLGGPVGILIGGATGVLVGSLSTKTTPVRPSRHSLTSRSRSGSGRQAC